MIMHTCLQNDAYAVPLEDPLLHSTPLRAELRSKDKPLRHHGGTSPCLGGLQTGLTIPDDRLQMTLQFTPGGLHPAVVSLATIAATLPCA